VDLRNRLRRTAKVRAEGRKLLLVSPDVLLGDQREADEVGEAPETLRVDAGLGPQAPVEGRTLPGIGDLPAQLREHDRLAFLRAHDLLG
jgi:hypothetical protein